MRAQATIPLGSTAAPSAAVTYLRQIEELREEIQSSMLAIAGNSLSVLEGSLWRQEVLCTSLRHLSQSLASEDAGSPLMSRIRETSLALQDLNRTYSLLIQHSSQSADLLQRLCRNYTASAPLSPSNLSGSTQTWSCEV